MKKPHRMYYVDDMLYVMSEEHAAELKLKGHYVFDLYDSLEMTPEYYDDDYVFCYDTKREEFNP